MNTLSFTVDWVLVVCMSFGYRSIFVSRYPSKQNNFLNVLGMFPLTIGNTLSVSKAIKADLCRGHANLQMLFLGVLEIIFHYQA